MQKAERRLSADPTSQLGSLGERKSPVTPQNTLLSNKGEGQR